MAAKPLRFRASVLSCQHLLAIENSPNRPPSRIPCSCMVPEDWSRRGSCAAGCTEQAPLAQGMPIIEAIAVLAGLLSVWLLLRQSILCWPAGLLQVCLYLFIFHEARLYSGVVLQAIYVATHLYGWLHWWRAQADGLPVSRLRRGEGLAWLLLTLAGSAAWGAGMSRVAAAAPYPDAFIAVCSLAAQWLMVRKKLENWLFWIAVDLVAIALYWQQGLHLTTLLYLVFLLLSCAGFRSWRRELLAREGAYRQEA